MTYPCGRIYCTSPATVLAIVFDTTQSEDDPVVELHYCRPHFLDNILGEEGEEDE